MRPRVLIVDDHDGFRDAVAASGYDVVGSAANGRQALTEAARVRPDIVLLDIQLPELDGFAVADRLAGEPGAAAVVLISGHDAVTYGPRLAAAPARGILAKRDLSGAALAALVG